MKQLLVETASNNFNLFLYVIIGAAALIFLFIQFSPFQHFLQFLPSPFQPARNRGMGKVQRIRNFVHIHSLIVVQEDHFPQLIGQLHHRLRQFRVVPFFRRYLRGQHFRRHVTVHQAEPA